MWWAGKELQRGKLLSDYVGKNDKTKIIAKLQKAGGGPPVREPIIDQESYKNMLAYYRKKEEEMKVKLLVIMIDNVRNWKRIMMIPI